ncbi:hypothetical protein BCR44DRAFT_116332 [Catenaria anguillulae PL171]|uniref:NodB homology domain-containing protein n=1 Tax=Catenaria anguillulae PL171 TaxID=765915 RepID=A0A1Y2HU88_9FUNG|nr:hypothetical protein BCR44DRAFT_116332 [Catenaria anguillulae PL171]
MGWSLAVHTDVARRALREGHHLASHTWGHPDLTTVTIEQLDKEIKDTEAVISQLLGGQWRPRYMRPPYGSVNRGVMRRLSKHHGYRVILWDFDTNDWRPEITPGHIRFQYAQLCEHDPSKESFITLQHDVHAKTVHVAAHVYEQVKAAGFAMVPMYVCVNEPAYSAVDEKSE